MMPEISSRAGTRALASIAILSIATAAGLGYLYQKEGHDTACQRDAAASDRAALYQLEKSQRDHLRTPSQHTAADVVHDINHFLLTVKADDARRAQC